MSENKREIESISEVRLMVDLFYEKIRKDNLLKDIFNQIMQDKWPEHLEKMYRFWQTLLLEENTYNGNPFGPHARLPVDKEHFDRWLTLFVATVDENFSGEKAFEAKWRAEKMAIIFQTKIEFFKNSE
jgi:hemoglobin